MVENKNTFACVLLRAQNARTWRHESKLHDPGYKIHPPNTRVWSFRRLCGGPYSTEEGARECFPSYLESVVSKGGLPLPAVRLIFQQCAQEFCTGFKFWVDLGLWLILFYWLGVGSQGFRFRRVSRLGGFHAYGTVEVEDAS